MDNKFPDGFLFGAGTSSAQIEGGANEGGRTPSIWDVAPKKKIKHGENSLVACDHFHHMKEDVGLMKEIGLNTYSFSISWSRVVPEEGKINQKGLEFYSNLIDELLAAKICPIVTIYHWDLPLWVDKMGGWMNEKIVDEFEFYTKAVVDALSDRVTYWVTINEPQCFIMNGYMQGVHAPFKRNYLALPRLTKNCMLAHAACVRTIRKYAKQTPKVGIKLSSGAYVPKSESEKDIDEARRLTFESLMGTMNNKWWFDPILSGKKVNAFVIYRQNEKYMEQINQPLDFLGLNNYEPLNPKNDESMYYQGQPYNSLGWRVDERGLYWDIRFMYERYHLPIMVTENGLALNDVLSLDKKVHDPQRTDFIKRHLGSLKRAVNEGIPVFGYSYWSLLDNFEWAEGYDPRFGLVYVDYKTQKRILKDSATEYKKIIENNSLEQI